MSTQQAAGTWAIGSKRNGRRPGCYLRINIDQDKSYAEDYYVSTVLDLLLFHEGKGDLAQGWNLFRSRAEALEFADALGVIFCNTKKTIAERRAFFDLYLSEKFQSKQFLQG